MFDAIERNNELKDSMVNCGNDLKENEKLGQTNEHEGED